MKTVVLALMVLVVVSQGTNVSYEDVLKHLNLTKTKELYSMIRPVKDYREPTRVYLEMLLLAVLDVREMDQTFVSFIQIYMKWEHPHICWDPDQFDGLYKMRVPADLLWKPDVTIEEMLEKDNSVPNPFITIQWNGYVTQTRELMVVSSCKMNIYKFPFDTQSCTLSLSSMAYPVEELRFEFYKDSEMVTEMTRQRIQSDWQFMNMTVQYRPQLSQKQSVIYTITMKRNQGVFITNFLVPIMFLYCLDLASFLMSDSGGEKVSFKVTVLLAVTVMQLLLNEMLPSSSDVVPLIAVYCIGMFGLMMINLLETILVMYLIEKDSASDKQGNYDGDVKKWTQCVRWCKVSDDPPSELLSMAKEEQRGELMEESKSLEKLLDALSEAVKALSLLLSRKEERKRRKEERKPGYWTRVARKLDIIFFFVYVTVSAVFLVVIFSKWTKEDE
ncbi:5-hydroxytryptamine receptor 3A-like isoform X1 [Trematomus bernacchii]|uniref:5-hydroxytryptamine receptor 3A-like isoform X1 n=1 Tax=Trematomus bernacchii TaxID=40690 RepID=UPI00146CD560|nr:5-hydroxytryptamine receptor 3A-like isoform X1 [Trematomus bernacchii]